MIRFIDHLPEGVIGIEVTGHVTANEYKTCFEPVMRAFLQQHSTVSYLVHLKTTVSELDAGVWWEDFKLAIGHLSKWNKIAIVSGQPNIVKAVDIFGFALPGKHKAFSEQRYQDAVDWIS